MNTIRNYMTKRNVLIAGGGLMAYFILAGGDDHDQKAVNNAMSDLMNDEEARHNLQKAIKKAQKAFNVKANEAVQLAVHQGHIPPTEQWILDHTVPERTVLDNLEITYFDKYGEHYSTDT